MVCAIIPASSLAPTIADRSSMHITGATTAIMPFGWLTLSSGLLVWWIWNRNKHWAKDSVRRTGLLVLTSIVIVALFILLAYITAGAMAGTKPQPVYE